MRIYHNGKEDRNYWEIYTLSDSGVTLRHSDIGGDADAIQFAINKYGSKIIFYTNSDLLAYLYKDTDINVVYTGDFSPSQKLVRDRKVLVAGY